MKHGVGKGDGLKEDHVFSFRAIQWRYSFRKK